MSDVEINFGPYPPDSEVRIGEEQIMAISAEIRYGSVFKMLDTVSEPYIALTVDFVKPKEISHYFVAVYDGPAYAAGYSDDNLYNALMGVLSREKERIELYFDGPSTYVKRNGTYMPFTSVRAGIDAMQGSYFVVYYTHNYQELREGVQSIPEEWKLIGKMVE